MSFYQSKHNHKSNSNKMISETIQLAYLIFYLIGSARKKLDCLLYKCIYSIIDGYDL